MAIIVTPKGWAIEFEPVKSETKALNALQYADEYTSVLQSLVQTIKTAQSNSELTESPDYYTLLLLENMLPDIENAKAMFQNLFEKEASPQKV